ncbi:hypothetical protein APT63_09355 [Pseudomonas sp. 22-AL-CL-001]|nr:hypothetical protein APT63_09355 [Pseudomonas monteilii]
MQVHAAIDPRACASFIGKDQLSFVRLILDGSYAVQYTKKPEYRLFHRESYEVFYQCFFFWV